MSDAAQRLNDIGVDAGDVAAVAAASYGAIRSMENAVIQMNREDPSFASRINEVSETIRSTPGMSELLASRPDIALRSADQIVRGVGSAPGPQYQQPQNYGTQQGQAFGPPTGPAHSPWHHGYGVVPSDPRQAYDAQVEAFARRRLREGVSHPGLDLLEGRKVDPRGW